MRRLPRWVDVLWLGLLSVYIMAGFAKLPLHTDEFTLIYMGADYHHTLLTGGIGHGFL